MSGGRWRHAVISEDHAALALFRGHSLKMRHGLLYLRAVAMWALDLVGVVLLEAQMHFERPVTRTTIIVIGWHTLSFTCVHALAGELCPRFYAKTVPDTTRRCGHCTQAVLQTYLVGLPCHISGHAVADKLYAPWHRTQSSARMLALWYGTHFASLSRRSPRTSRATPGLPRHSWGLKSRRQDRCCPLQGWAGPRPEQPQRERSSVWHANCGPIAMILAGMP